jgi:hypothetical protein
MRWTTSRLVVFPVGRGTRLRFRRVGVPVISQFCVRDGEASGGRMVGLSGKFPVKPEGTDVRRILIAHAMGHKSGVGNGHKILGEFAAGTAEGESVFTDCSLSFKSHVLQDNRITHKHPPFRQGNSRKCQLRSLLNGARGFERATNAAHLSWHTYAFECTTISNTGAIFYRKSAFHLRLQEFPGQTNHPGAGCRRYALRARSTGRRALLERLAIHGNSLYRNPKCPFQLEEL